MHDVPGRDPAEFHRAVEWFRRNPEDYDALLRGVMSPGSSYHSWILVGWALNDRSKPVNEYP